MHSPSAQKPGIEFYLVVIVFVILGLTYSIVTPVFEASDELFHYPVVQYIATKGRLPVQEEGQETLWEQEGSQPPLYYLLGALLTGWIDTSDLEDVRRLNPHTKIGIPGETDNANLTIRTDAESFPWKGSVLAVHVIRVFGVALGTASIIAAYMLFRTIWPADRWLWFLAASLMAFNPMFLFITASVNNDNLMVLIGTWLLLLVAKVVTDELTAVRAVLISVLVAAGALTKISGLTFLPVVVIALAISAKRTGKSRPVIATCLVIGAVTLAAAGWWYLRNFQLYGELFGLETMVAIAGPRDPISLWDLRHEWYGFWVSYWALFGGVNVLADKAVYMFYGLISVAAIIGCLLWIMKTIKRESYQDLILPGLLALQVVITFVGVVRWTLMTYASQGRLLFPVIAAISALIALGLVSLAPERFRIAVAFPISGVTLTIAALSPFLYIAPAYQRPPVVVNLPPESIPLGITYQDTLEIVAVTAPNVPVRGEGRLPVTVYLRLLSDTEDNYSLYIDAFGRDMSKIGAVNSYPGGGSLPTTAMAPGAIYQDQYFISIDEQAETPTMVRLNVGVGLLTPDGYVVLEGTTPGGALQSGTIVESGAAYPASMEECESPPEEFNYLAEFSGLAELRGRPLDREVFRPSDSVAIQLHWLPSDLGDRNWTVFIHLIDSDGEMIAQADGPPLNNDYPTTRWHEPCGFLDPHILPLPADISPGEYRVLIGLYDPSDPVFPRAAAVSPDGSTLAGNAIPFATITVRAD